MNLWLVGDVAVTVPTKTSLVTSFWLLRSEITLLEANILVLTVIVSGLIAFIAVMLAAIEGGKALSQAPIIAAPISWACLPEFNFALGTANVPQSEIGR
ncbi:hypothetical protein MAXJ12_29355 [Mesorhizobium alhagi CCNWXJ12-2]|uniref:Uncharacterized protein n=1 Tax=Mesorhizobium alhagi CCNWXJ12-2 TaxID=1107882 RepID=H0I084_9HYPH|nr:hypothetical protein MAXJ12_29355 [Mesorhizobium alhagi CCNWXJ12-2]